ncbi:MAG: polymerase [Pseudonocardiales bacterium]|nr:polymerase [Pseudonocardiales bacterium]
MGRSADLPRQSGQTDGDDSGATILHVDMDAFFASVEIRRRPELRGKPVIVGGGQRGVVSAASYAARRYGIRSAMPMSIALRRCPTAIVLPPDHATYSAVSAEIMKIFRSVTPLVEPLSMDEAFLDVAGVRRLLGRPADIARQIRAKVETEQQLTCSVGIAPSKFVAKVASARCKPDGMLVVPADRVLEFLHPLPITALWGVGPSTSERLARLGLRTVADVAHTPLDVLTRAVGSGGAAHLSALAQGLDPRVVETEHTEKSVSVDRTFITDMTGEVEIERELLRLAHELSSRVRARGLAARTIGIKVRFADFKTITRVRTLPEPVDGTDHIHLVAVELYRGLKLDQARIRLLGVKAEGLGTAGSDSRQLSFDDLMSEAPAITPTAPSSVNGAVKVGPRPLPSHKIGSAALDLISDRARQRFGPGALRRASLLSPRAEANAQVSSPQPSAPGPSVRSSQTESNPAPEPQSRGVRSENPTDSGGSVASGFRRADSTRMLGE